MLNVDFAQEAMNNVNIIRERAGLTGTSQLTADKLALMMCFMEMKPVEV